MALFSSRLFCAVRLDSCDGAEVAAGAADAPSFCGDAVDYAVDYAVNDAVNDAAAAADERVDDPRRRKKRRRIRVEARWRKRKSDREKAKIEEEKGSFLVRSKTDGRSKEPKVRGTETRREVRTEIWKEGRAKV